MPAAAVLSPAAIDACRLELVRVAVGELRRAAVIDLLARGQVVAAAGGLASELRAQGQELTERVAPALLADATALATRLGLGAAPSMFQGVGGPSEGAAYLADVVVLPPRAPALLDDAGRRALVAHALAHRALHGAAEPVGATLAAARLVRGRSDVDGAVRAAAARLELAAELSADRLALLATGDVDGALQALLVTSTGLPAAALRWDRATVEAEARALVDAAAVPGAATLALPALRRHAVAQFARTPAFGAGPGDVVLAELDASLARLVAAIVAEDAAAPSGDAPSAAPPPELYDAALAAATLVALADGELSDDELLTLERIFGGAVPDFRRRLERDAALAELPRSGPIVVAHGPAMVRALFELVAQVLLVDGRAEAREVATLRGIGDALGVARLVDAWLVAALRAAGLPAPDAGAPREALPLAPRADEAGAALAAFCAAMARRGGGETTLGRLARLLGSAEVTSAICGRIQAALDAAQLRAPLPLDATRADERLVLIGPAPVAAVPPPAAPIDADRAALLRALGRLRDDLVSGDGRSPSVRIREVRKGRTFDLASLERTSVGAGERALATVLGGKVAGLVTAADIGKHEPSRAVAAELLELHREHQARLEETGADDLWLGYPMLTGVADGYLHRGPLMLHSVDLVRDAEGARGFRLAPRTSDEPIVNQSLLQLVFHKLGYALPESLRDELDAAAADESRGAEAVIAALAKLGLGTVKLSGKLGPLRNRDAELEAKQAHCEIEECAVLGLFPQSSSDLLHDYDALIEELGVPTADVGALLGAARALLPVALRGDAPAAVTVAGGQVVQPAIAADPSQRAVLAEARTAPALVVDGPPGTGKSQVIANLIVDALTRGERVAVVCEKRAALDVVAQRLGGLGLAAGLAVVHDVALDRKALYAQLALRLETPPTPVPDAGKHAAIEAEAAGVERELAARSEALASCPPGAAMSLGQLHTLVAGLDAPALTLVNDPSILTDAQRDAILETLELVWAHADLVGPGGATREPAGTARRPSLATSTDAQLAELAAQLGAAADRADALAALAGAAGASPTAAVLDASAALDALADAAPARADADGQRWFAALAAPAAGAARADVAAATEAWQATRTAALAVGVAPTAPEAPALEGQVALVQAWAGRFLRFFALAWWRARGAVKRALPTYLPERAGHPLGGDVLTRLLERLAALRGWSALRRAVAALPAGPTLPADAVGADAVASKLGASARAATALVAHRAALAALGLDLGASTDAAVFDRTLAARVAHRDAASAVQAALAPVAAALPWLDVTTLPATLRALRDVMVRDGVRLLSVERALADARAKVPAAPALVDELLDRALEAGAGDLGRARRALRRAHAAAQVLAAERRSPIAATLADPLACQREVRQGDALADLEAKRAAALVERVRAALDAGTLAQTRAAKPRARRTAEQSTREAMLKETKKQRRVMPLRTFVRRFADDGLLELAPVWLLSPETMAILFPRAPLFDLVIFDEASQCTVESGLPVLLRAERAIIAGDDKQMPPTSFFASGTPDDEPADEAAARDLLADESLLTLAQTRVPRRRLLWHYRCKHESLIAFSNHAMYDGTLRTIPSTSSAAAAPALHWHAVEDATGAYDAGKNPVEARAVVDLIGARLARTPTPTIGVVTFNLEQRAAVHEAIDARRASDPEFGKRWDAAMANPAVDQQPFVKNLEGVQGDERDVIIFSLGHAPVPRKRAGGQGELYVPARFGPLGQRGGERRLNVAISRAKAECVVVASFTPAQLSVGNSTNLGPALLRQYLEFAHHLSAGRRVEADLVLARAGQGAAAPAARPVTPLPCPDYVPLAVQIAQALTVRGVRTDTFVGTSSFRVPVAVLDAADPTRYRLAILTDEGEPDAAAAQSPLERFVHRPGVLRQRGFDVVRVTAAEWHAAPVRVLDAICARTAAPRQ